MLIGGNALFSGGGQLPGSGDVGRIGCWGDLVCTFCIYVLYAGALLFSIRLKLTF